jgi:hypothetical protein
MWDAHLVPNREAEISLPEGHTAILLVRRGPVSVNGTTTVPEGQVTFLERHGGTFRLQSAVEAAVLVLGGEPINGPVVGRGPFVMNTDAEIDPAFRDFRSGRFGQIA